MKFLSMADFSSGMYAIGVKDHEKLSACIATAVMVIGSQEPPLVAVSINRSNYSDRCIEESGLFTISLLSENTPGFVIGALGLTSGAHGGKLENIRHRVLVEGVPIIKESCCCWFLCRVKHKSETSTQSLYIAEILAGSEETVGTPMTLDFYRTRLKGVIPKNAPMYLSPEHMPKWEDEQSFACSVCGYVYSHKNMAFEELPEDWLCPVCKMPKKVFVRR